ITELPARVAANEKIVVPICGPARVPCEAVKAEMLLLRPSRARVPKTCAPSRPGCPYWMSTRSPASPGITTMASITARTPDFEGLRSWKNEFCRATAACELNVPYRNQLSRARFSAPEKKLKFGWISVESWADGGPPFMLNHFCRKRLKRPTKISLKRAIELKFYAGLATMIPSIVGVSALTSSITSLRRSPAAATHESAGVLSSEGVTPAVPPACTGVRSRIVSDPL